MDPILTVVGEASTYDLVDLATVKDELGITDTASDTKLQRWITGTSTRFANLCGIVFPEESLSDVFRADRWPYHYPPRVSELVLSRRPVTVITSVTEGTNALTTADYETNTKAGLLYRLTGDSRSHWCGSPITILYNAGYYPIPSDVQEAVLAVLRHRWLSNGRDPLLRSFSIEGVGAETYWVSGGQAEGDLPSDLQQVADTIAYYRKRVAV